MSFDFLCLSGRRLFYFTWHLSADLHGDRCRHFTAFVAHFAHTCRAGKNTCLPWYGTVLLGLFLYVLHCKDYAIARNVAVTIADHLQ